MMMKSKATTSLIFLATSTGINKTCSSSSTINAFISSSVNVRPNKILSQLLFYSSMTNINTSSHSNDSTRSSLFSTISSNSNKSSFSLRGHSKHTNDDTASPAPSVTASTLSSQTLNEIQMSQDALEISKAAIHAVDPQVAIEKHLIFSKENMTLTVKDSSITTITNNNNNNKEHIYNLKAYDSILICAFGKAATAMALQSAQIISKSNIPIQGGIVITKYDHATKTQINHLQKLYNIDVHFASHPIPDNQSIISSNLLLHKIQSSSTSKSTLVLNCISGGGSSLFCTPQHPLTLDIISNVNKQLLACGMPIQDMNIIRKKLEVGKGGGLANLIYPGTSITLVLSDVIGDPLDLIASGPTVLDTSTYVDAWRLIERYDLVKGGKYELPQIVLDHFLDHVRVVQKQEDLVVQGRDPMNDCNDDYNDYNNRMFCTNCDYAISKGTKLSETVLVGNNAQAVYAAAEEAKRLGYNPIVLGTTIDGEAIHIANMYMTMAEQVQSQRKKSSSTHFPFVQLPAALIGGGETTVTLSQRHGKGGRNQEMGLTAALRMKSKGLRDIVFTSIGTDGTDGPTDAAGATVDGGTIDRIEYENGVTILGKDALEQHDAYNFFNSASKTNALIKTGPTGTNVADVYFTLIQ